MGFYEKMKGVKSGEVLFCINCGNYSTKKSEENEPK
ncbi:hypothetical protein ABH966_004961 [Lysinibacillus sp. RC46]